MGKTRYGNVLLARVPVAWSVGQGWEGKIRILVKGAPLKAYFGAPFLSAFFVLWRNPIPKFELLSGFSHFRNIRKCKRSEQKKFQHFFIEIECLKSVIMMLKCERSEHKNFDFFKTRFKFYFVV